MRAVRCSVLLLLLAVSAGAQTRIPLNDLGTRTYLGFEGGLYERGSNLPPPDHSAAGLEAAAAVVPRDGRGLPSKSGKVVMISVGMSNTTQEYCASGNPAPCTSWSFAGQALADGSVNHSTLVLVNGARGGQTADTWDAATDANYDLVRDQNLAPAGLTEAQVQVAWVKVANSGPRTSLPADGADALRLVQQTGNIARALKARYPNLRIVYLSSRIYAGYATSALNPEPYAYESGFAVKWVVQAQIDQLRKGAIVNATAGDLDYRTVAPWIAWGPYLWADGLSPRSDGLTWERGDLAADGTHPSQSGQRKVGAMLLSFLSAEPTAGSWFLQPVPPRRRAVRTP